MAPRDPAQDRTLSDLDHLIDDLAEFLGIGRADAIRVLRRALDEPLRTNHPDTQSVTPQ